MTFPVPMRNPAIEEESGVEGPDAYANGEYPVALDEAQHRQLEVRGWEPVLVSVDDLSTLSKDELVAAVEQAGLEAPRNAKKDDLARTLTKGGAEVVLDRTQTPPAVVVNTDPKE